MHSTDMDSTASSCKLLQAPLFPPGKRGMKRFLYFCFLALVIVAGCSPAGNCSAAQSSDPVVHILFIGNSYTYVNDLPGVFSQLACAGGHKVETAMAAEGGWTLADHIASSQTLEKLNQEKWDYVVLQEQSEMPAIEVSRTRVMYPAVRLLVHKIEELGAVPILFMTWGHADGVPEAGILTYEDMQARLYTGYMDIARELRIPVAPVGSAWLEARSQPTPLDLWQSDGSHPNENGTYLAACVFYATLFRQSPEGLSYRSGLSLETAQALQTIAAHAVLGE
jgi:hypothetical protein